MGVNILNNVQLVNTQFAKIHHFYGPAHPLYNEQMIQKASFFCLLVPALALVGCSDSTNSRKTDPAVTPSEPAPAQLDPRTAQMWSRSCALCHVDGNASAPRLGHPEEWSERTSKGLAVLMQNTIEGYNDMPPLGYCMACEAEDFAAMISFMSGNSFEASDL